MSMKPDPKYNYVEFCVAPGLDSNGCFRFARVCEKEGTGMRTSKIQLHWQNNAGPDGKTEAKAQRTIWTPAEFLEFLKATQDRFPVPEGHEWLVVLEQSEYFVADFVNE